MHTIKPKGALPGPSSVTELPFYFINLSAKWVAFAGQQEKRRSWCCPMPRSAEQKPHAQQDRKEDQVGQGEQPKILLLPLWQLPCDLPVGNKTGHGCDQSAKTSQIGADDEGLCLCREPGQQQGGGNITGDLRSKNRHKNFPAGQKLLQPAGKGRNAPQIANEDEKATKVKSRE